MDVLIRFLLVSVCAWAHCAALTHELQRRSHGYGTYGGAYERAYERDYERAYERAYEPYVYAAVPLHAPVPVLRVVSAAPLAARPAASYHQPMYARTPPDSQYLTASYELLYDEEQHNGETQKYEATYTRPQYQPIAMDSQEAILYARPNPQGGHVYRKRSGAKNSPKKISSPVIFRIHKYKIVKDGR